MIIDTNVNLSRWPFRRTPCDELPALVAKLRKAKVAQAWTGSLDGIFHRDVGGVNQRLYDSCREHRELLVPFGCINPTLPDWPEDLRRCHEDYAMPGIRLHPNYHGYTLSDERFEQLLALATERRLIVQVVIRMDDPRVQHHLMQVNDVDVSPLPAILRSLPKTKLMLLNSLRTVRVPQLVEVVNAGNVHVEISMLEGIAGISKMLKSVPLTRLDFGSHLPLFVIESALLKLDESPLSKSQRLAICRGNADRLRFGD